MSDPTPNFITEDQFNQAVKDWSVKTRDRIRRRAPVGIDSLPDEKKLIFTKESIHKNHGTINKVTFSFERHGVFVHYGVGRGYVRSGNAVVRGRKLNQAERKGKYARYSAKEVAKMKIIGAQGAIKRVPVDWCDIEIKTGIKALSDIAQGFYGDHVLKNLLRQMDKALIEKK
jgi:hypothetical protein